jgi:hypothetical protein
MEIPIKNLTDGEAQELKKQLPSVLEGMGDPIGKEITRDFKLGGRTRSVRFTVVRVVERQPISDAHT